MDLDITKQSILEKTDNQSSISSFIRVPSGEENSVSKVTSSRAHNDVPLAGALIQDREVCEERSAEEDYRVGTLDEVVDSSLSVAEVKNVYRALVEADTNDGEI